MTGAMFEEEMDETDQKCRECGEGGGEGQLESRGEREREVVEEGRSGGELMVEKDD